MDVQRLCLHRARRLLRCRAVEIRSIRIPKGLHRTFLRRTDLLLRALLCGLIPLRLPCRIVVGNRRDACLRDVVERGGKSDRGSRAKHRRAGNIRDICRVQRVHLRRSCRRDLRLVVDGGHSSRCTADVVRHALKADLAALARCNGEVNAVIAVRRLDRSLPARNLRAFRDDGVRRRIADGDAEVAANRDICTRLPCGRARQRHELLFSA